MKVPVLMPSFDDEMKDAAVDALQNERMVLGESVHKFEEEFASYIGVKHALSVSSGTNALSIAMEAIGTKGKDVLTPAMSFIATANSVLHAGGTPKFVDIDARTANLDPAMLNDALTSKTAGILPVHLYGHTAEMDPIQAFADENDLWVIEDACQAHGAAYKQKKAGSIGKVGCFSFYTTKNMTVGGDGGMITTNDSEMAELMGRMRDCGRLTHYEHDILGYTSRLNTVNAAIGRVQLKNLDLWNAKRREAARFYQRNLGDIEGLTLAPEEDPDHLPVYYVYTIRTSKRDQLIEHLKEHEVGAMIHFPIPMHLQPFYTQKYDYRPGMHPVSEKLGNEVMSIPMFPGISKDQLGHVCDTIKDFFGE